MQAKLPSSKNSMAKILIRFLQPSALISSHFNMKIISWMFGISEGKGLSVHIGETILSKLMVLFGLSIARISFDWKTQKQSFMHFWSNKNWWVLLFLFFVISKIFQEVLLHSKLEIFWNSILLILDTGVRLDVVQDQDKAYWKVLIG